MKKLFAVFLSACMLMCFMPSMAFADGETGGTGGTTYPYLIAVAATDLNVSEAGDVTFSQNSIITDKLTIEDDEASNFAFFLITGENTHVQITGENAINITTTGDEETAPMVLYTPSYDSSSKSYDIGCGNDYNSFLISTEKNGSTYSMNYTYRESCLPFYLDANMAYRTNSIPIMDGKTSICYVVIKDRIGDNISHNLFAYAKDSSPDTSASCDFATMSEVKTVNKNDPEQGTLYKITIPNDNIAAAKNKCIGVNISSSTDNTSIVYASVAVDEVVPQELSLIDKTEDNFDEARTASFGNTGCWFKFTPGSQRYCGIKIYDYNTDIDPEVIENSDIVVFNPDGSTRLTFENGAYFNTDANTTYYGYAQANTDTDEYSLQLQLTKKVEGTAAIKYDSSKCSFALDEARILNGAEVNGGTITNVVTSEPDADSMITKTITLLYDYYDTDKQTVPCTITPKSGYKCAGFTYLDGSSVTQVAPYHMSYAHHYNILDASGNPLIDENGNPLGIENQYGTKLPANNFYCNTIAYDTAVHSSVGWEDVTEMVRVCKENNYIAKLKDSYIEWNPNIAIGDNYTVSMIDDNTPNNITDVVIDGLNNSYAPKATAVGATPDQTTAVEKYTGKEIEKVYDLSASGINNENLGKLVTVSIPCSDPSAYDVVWLKDSTDAKGKPMVTPVPMTTTDGIGCISFDTGHFSSYALVKAQQTPSYGGGATAPSAPVIDAAPVVSGDTASSTISSSAVDTAIKNAAAGSSKEITINASAGSGSVKDSKVTLNKTDMQKISDTPDSKLTIKTDAGNVTLDKDTLAKIAGAAEGNDITIEVKVTESNDNTLKSELIITSGGKKISGLGSVSAKVTLRPSSTLAGKDLECVGIDENGNYTVLESVKNADGSYTFTANGSASYALMEKAAVEKQLAKQEAASFVKSKIKASAAASAGKIRLTWTKVTSSHKVVYQVFRSKSKYGKFVKIATVSKNGLTNTKVAKGKRYYYKVRAVLNINGNRSYTKLSKPVSAVAK